MPTIAQTTDGRFVRLCWCCRETGHVTPAGSARPRRSQRDAAREPGKCRDCHQRALAGLPTGRRIDA